MRVSFSSENDFNATYHLPGYGCVAEVEVRNGIVTLDVHDEDREDEITKLEVDDELVQYCNGVPCYQPFDDEFENDANYPKVEYETDLEEFFDNANSLNELLDEDDSIEDETTSFFDNIDDDEVTIEIEENETETPIEQTDEYKFVKAIQKIDKDGSMLALLDSLTKNKNVRNITKKASETFNNVIKELSAALDSMK